MNDQIVMHTLKRKEFGVGGIISDFTFHGELSPFMVTLEHAYFFNGAYTPKLHNGVYTCVRGPHRLHGMDDFFSTFEITKVSGHSGILFHWGNYNEDSEGCILTGSKQAVIEERKMITDSRKKFTSFMARLDGVDSFMLQVI